MSKGWHGLPGCAGCVDPVNMQHQEGCRLRAKDAGHRHAEDFFGQSLYIGDRVAAMVPQYRSLGAATVVAITAKRIRVKWNADCGYTARQGKEFTTEDAMVVKVSL